MYLLHIANKHYSSWSLRPWVLMRELDIPFEEQLSPFEPESNWIRFRDFSPSGLVPCLVDAQQVVWESLAIVEYLSERHPGVWPSDTEARTWARCASAEMHAGFAVLRRQCPMSCGVRVRMEHHVDALRHDLTRLDELWQQGLTRFGGPFLAGKAFSAVDAFYAPVAFRAQSFALPLAETSQAYVERLLALPSMQQWYEEALVEPWIDPKHEQEIEVCGTILADYRQHRRTTQVADL